VAKGPWILGPETELPAGVDVPGRLRERFPGCDLFCVNSIAAGAGLPATGYYKRLIATSPAELFHTHPIVDIGWAGCRARDGDEQRRAGREEPAREGSSLPSPQPQAVQDWSQLGQLKPTVYLQ
jgi:hypothetical protein